MQRLCAILLLVPMAALSLEWVEAPAFCARAHSSACGTMANPGSSHICCKSKGKKKEGKAKKDATACIDCPLCCPVTYTSIIRLELIQATHKAAFTVMSDNNLSDYATRHWKPPNA